MKWIKKVQSIITVFLFIFLYTLNSCLAEGNKEDVYNENKKIYTIGENEYFDEVLFSIELIPGIYEISCEQDHTLLFVERNRFNYICNGVTTYEEHDNLYAGRHKWTVTLEIEGKYEFKMWVVAPSRTIQISDFRLVKIGEISTQIKRPKPDSMIDTIKQTSNNTFILFSDIHGSKSNYQRIISFGENNGVNGIINAGDTVEKYLQDEDDSFSWYREGIEQSSVDIISAVGNHDLWKGGYWKQANINDSYNQIIAPIVEKNNRIQQPQKAKENNLCYYYIDYGQIRIIVLNAMSGDKSVSYWDNRQANWLREILTDSLNNQMHVIVVNHAPFPKDIALRDIQSNWNSFIDYRSWDMTDEIVMELSAVQIIQRFIDDGGILICLITGHEHVDSILTAQGYEGQFMINIASANHMNHLDGITTDDLNSPFYDCFDFCGIDTNNGMIKILRIGWSIDASLKIREVLSYDYFTKQILYQ